jgi:uncharacterized protein YndB with AHSA1/START domain
MDRTLRIEKKLTIEAAPVKVWEALTTRKIISRYFFGTDAISDWTPGSPLVFRGQWEGKTYEDKGKILEVEPGEKLVYNYWSGFSGLKDHPDNYSVVTCRLSEEGSSCILNLVQEGFANEEALGHADGGWTAVLDNLKKLLED